MSQTSQGIRLAVYYHTHWDREWYLPFRSYQVRLADVVDEVLERLEQKILPCFMLDGQTVVLDDYLELRPENRERLQRFIESGQLSIGPWFVMPDEFLVGGESLIRNLLRGIREASAWGCHRFTGYLPDTFGHSADMPTILKNFGLDSTVLWRGVNPAKSLLRWQSPSGASVLALHLTDGYFQMMLHDWTATQPQQVDALDALIDKLKRVSPSNGMELLPIGGDHLAPISEAGHALLRKHYPDLLETTPDQFLATIQANGSLETVSGELIENSGSFLLPGVYSSRLYLKQANRRLEHRLVHQLEPLLAMAQLLLPEGTGRYPRHELELAWKTLMLNHPHDSICGCSVDEVHRENEVRFDQVSQLGEALLHRAVSVMVAHHASPDQWLVLNTGDRVYTGVAPVVEDVADASEPTRLAQVEQIHTVLQDEYLQDAHRIPLSHLTKTRRQGWVWAESVPGYGLKVLSKQEAHSAPATVVVRVSESRLENNHLAVAVNPDGTLGVTDKSTGRVYLRLLSFQDQADQGDSYNSAPVPGVEPMVAEFKGSRSLYNGPLVGALLLTHGFPILGMTLHTEVRLDAGSQMLKFSTRFLNQTEMHKLQVVFPTGEPITRVEAETHLGRVVRAYDPDYREQDYMPVEKMKELKTNTGPVQRFFSANGQSWLTEGLTEYEVFGQQMRITLLRAFGALSAADTGVRGAQAGPPFATPEGQCLNRDMQCQYAWLPTPAQPCQLYEAANHFYGVAWGQSGTGSPDPQTPVSLCGWDNPNLVASACYCLPGRGLVLRLLNTSDVSASATLKARFAYHTLHELNFLEESMGIVSGTSVSIGPRDVKTWLFAV